MLTLLNRRFWAVPPPFSICSATCFQLFLPLFHRFFHPLFCHHPPQVCLVLNIDMLIAVLPIDGQRNNGLVLPRDSFKDQIDSTLNPHPKEPYSSGEIFEGCCCFKPVDKRRIAFRQCLDDLGIAYEEINTDSYRKGSGSSCAFVSTQAPPIVTICPRAGWKLGGVLNTDMVLENAGDCVVARVAAKLCQL